MKIWNEVWGVLDVLFETECTIDRVCISKMGINVWYMSVYDHTLWRYEMSLKLRDIVEPYFAQQWNLKTMNVPLAWQFGYGKDVVVGIIDSGLDGDHKDLGGDGLLYITANDSDAAKLAKYEPVMESIRKGEHPKILPGWNFLRNDDNTYDLFRHGTYLGGVMCAEIDKYGMAGVAPECRVRPYVVCDAKGRVEQADLAKAVWRAIDDDVDVINISLAWGGDQDKGATEAIYEAIRQGIIVAAATGNNNIGTVYYPARLKGVIAVGGCNSVGERWVHNFIRGSNFGKEMICLAPGASQISTQYMRSRFTNVDGTSMAAANASGVMALAKGVDRSITNADVIGMLSEGKVGELESGYGVLDAYRFLVKVSDGVKPNPLKLAIDGALEHLVSLQKSLVGIGRLAEVGACRWGTASTD